MALTRWDPFRELSIMQERMNRMFDDAGRGWRGDEPSSTTTWSPSVDIYETENEIMVQAELPGVDRKDIVLNLEKNVLTLKGERHFERGANRIYTPALNVATAVSVGPSRYLQLSTRRRSGPTTRTAFSKSHCPRRSR